MSHRKKTLGMLLFLVLGMAIAAYFWQHQLQQQQAKQEQERSARMEQLKQKAEEVRQTQVKIQEVQRLQLEQQKQKSQQERMAKNPISAMPLPPFNQRYARTLTQWKPLIQAYSHRHYGENTWQLKPTVIVLHFTVTQEFPLNLAQSTEFGGEKPGLATHYVVDGQQIWEILPPTVRSRGAYGINHRAINIEMVAMTAQELFHHRKATLNTTGRLVRHLMKRYQIPLEKIYSHEDVAKMDRRLIPEVLDLVNNKPYGRSDPGEQNQNYILSWLREQGAGL